MFGIFPSILFLGKNSLQVVVLFLEIVELFLNFSQLGDCSLIQTSFHLRFKVDLLSLVCLEPESSSVDPFFSIGYLASKFFRPFCQQSRNGWIVYFKSGGFYVFLGKERDSSGYFLPKKHIFLIVQYPSILLFSNRLFFLFLQIIKTGKILKTVIFISFLLFVVDKVKNTIGSLFRSLITSIFKDILHHLRKNLKIIVLLLNSKIKSLIRKHDQFIDNPHYILWIVSIIPVFNVNVIDKKEVKLIALSVVYDRHFWFYPFADPFASCLGIFFGYVVEDLISLLVDKFHYFVLYVEWKIFVFLQGLFDILKHIFWYEIFNLFLTQVLFIQMVVSYWGCYLYDIDQPISKFILERFNRYCKFIFDQLCIICAFECNFHLFISRVQLKVSVRSEFFYSVLLMQCN